MDIEKQNNLGPFKKPEEETMTTNFDFFELPNNEQRRLKNDLEAYRLHKSDLIHRTWGSQIEKSNPDEIAIHEAKLEEVYKSDALLAEDEHFYEAMQSKLMRRRYVLRHESGDALHKNSITNHIENTHDWLSQHGRIIKWKKEFNEPIFTGKRLKLKDMPEFTEEVDDFGSFKAALYSQDPKNIAKAKDWLNLIKLSPDELIPHVPEEAREQVYQHRKAEIKMFEELLDRKSFYFQIMVESQDFEEAEAWLESAKTAGNYDARTIDHRERELFKAYCSQGMWPEAKKIVEESVLESSRRTRQSRISELSDLNYNSI